MLRVRGGDLVVDIGSRIEQHWPRDQHYRLLPRLHSHGRRSGCWSGWNQLPGLYPTLVGPDRFTGVVQAEAHQVPETVPASSIQRSISRLRLLLECRSGPFQDWLQAATTRKGLSARQRYRPSDESRGDTLAVDYEPAHQVRTGHARNDPRPCRRLRRRS